MGKRILVFGAAVLDDRRKGIAMLMDAFRKLHDSMRAGAIARCSVGDVLLVVLGHGGSDLVTALPFAHTCLGYVHDERLLRLVYAAADYYVNPSLEDEGPMMLVQSLMCGTPAVSTPTLQAQDIVVSGVTGFLCGAVTADALAEALREALAWPRHGEMRVAARQAALTAVSREVFVSRYLAAVSGWVDRHSMA
jgi:glycosyltransferase involved in cell wall biosynthesis